MESKLFLTDLYAYHQWANLKYLALIETSSASNEDIYKLFNHIFNAQEIWNSRILSKPCELTPWSSRQIQTIKAASIHLHQESLDIINTSTLSKQITYKNSAGKQYTNTVQEILFHVVNHATYHRAQLASRFKQLQIDPPATDYIFYKRD